MRAYGRAGLRVGALACEQERSWAPALKSRWCSVAASAPDYTLDPDGYVDALLRFVKDTSARLVVPAHDGSIEALRLRRDELEYHTALGLADEPGLRVAVSKPRSLALATDLGIAVPRSVRLERAERCRPGGSAPRPSRRDEAGSVVGRPRRRRHPTVVGTCHDPRRRRAAARCDPGGRRWGSPTGVDPRSPRGGQPVLRRWSHLGPLGPGVPPGVAGPRWRLRALRDDRPPAGHRRGLGATWSRAMDLEGCSMVEFRRDRDGKPDLHGDQSADGRLGRARHLGGRRTSRSCSPTGSWAAPCRRSAATRSDVGCAGCRATSGTCDPCSAARASRTSRVGDGPWSPSSATSGTCRRSSTSSSSVICGPGSPTWMSSLLQHAKGRLRSMMSINRTEKVAAPTSGIWRRSGRRGDRGSWPERPQPGGSPPPPWRPLPHLRLAHADVARHAARHVPEVARVRDVDPESRRVADVPGVLPEQRARGLRADRVLDVRRVRHGVPAGAGARGRGHRGDAPRHVSGWLRAHARRR